MKNKKTTNKKTIAKLPQRYKGERYNMYRLISIVGYFVITGLLLLVFIQNLQHRRVQKELEKSELLLLEYEDRLEALNTEIQWLHELDYIEILARQRLGLVKPDEIVFQLED